MDRTMFEIRVYTTETGMIAIAGARIDSSALPVVLAPDQVEIFIKWLRQAKAELLEQRD
jgi:hypothetical protein